jgi:hypothetical protein
MVSWCFARSARRDHVVPETGHERFVVNGREARAKGRNDELTVKLLAHSRRRGRDSLEGACDRSPRFTDRWPPGFARPPHGR